MKLSQPWPEGYTVNVRSPFGWRVHPITGRRKFHHGIDVALPVGTPLTAPADGVVVKKGNGPSGGITLILKHEDNRHTVYYHLQKPSHLLKGTRVERGELIAYSGNTGASTGPHLHFEVRRSARWGDTVDPMPYLEAEETLEPEPVKPEPVEIPKPLPPGVPINKPEPVRPKPKWKPSAALARGFNRIRRAAK